MAIKELKILGAGKLLSEPLEIPNYQRPYKWTTESASVLFSDMYTAFCEKLPEFRIGSAVLHHEGNHYNIVDGQQRLTTLSLLMYCFSHILTDSKWENAISLLSENENFGIESEKAVNDNFLTLYRKCEELDAETLHHFADYVSINCTFVKIVTDSEQEAFQFFDSQNSRGKALAPHDLLKSYHLREMRGESEDEKLKVITEWENTDQKSLEHLFADNLYPLVRWYKKLSGLYYSASKIKAFKGIKSDTDFNYSIYHRAANLYIEQENSMESLIKQKEISPFVFTQPLIAGKRFFQYTQHYHKLKSNVCSLIDSTFSEELCPKNGSGNKYVRNLFINVALFFADRFNFESLTESRLRRLYAWCYSLRVVMYAVRIESVNNYALGRQNRINNGINLFARISEMQSPQELNSVVLETVAKEKLSSYKTEKYQSIWEEIFGGRK